MRSLGRLAHRSRVARIDNCQAQVESVIKGDGQRDGMAYYCCCYECEGSGQNNSVRYVPKVPYLPG